MSRLTVGGRRIRQINNMVLTQGQDGMFRVYAPGGECLEEFARQLDAERWMGSIIDFRKSISKSHLDMD
jgi:hypothetical protein